jgi:hypothetical protein
MKNQDQKTTSEQPKTKSPPGKNVENINTANIEDKIELARKDAYIEPQTRDLLRKLLEEGDDEEIIPIYSPAAGFEYKTACSPQENTEECNLSRETLENLSQLGILKKTFYESVSICPNCQSTILTLHNRCPKCKNHNVQKTSLTEHIPCGYIDQRNKYINDRCPKCGDPLVEGEYKNMGRWYICQECGEKFENPEFDLKCQQCCKTFVIKEAQVTDVPKFSLNLARKKEIRQNVASLETIKKLLTELKFNIQIPGLIVGQKSGMTHHFSLIAKKQVNDQEINIALDHSVSEIEIQPSPMILYLYKTSEVKVDIPIFVAVPKLSETTQKIAQGHNILIIEGSTDAPEVLNRIKKEIEDRISQVTQNKPTTEKQVEEPKEKPVTTFFSKFLASKKRQSS